MKKTFLLLALGAFIFFNNTGCKSGAKQATDSTKVGMTVDSFLLSPEKWAGKDIVIVGTISHVCKESGKKLFLFGADAEKTVKVNAGGEFATFDIKYEGNDIELTGTVVEDEKIDVNYLNEWEADIKKNIDDKDVKVCTEESKAIAGQNKDTTKANKAKEDPYAEVKEFRKKLETSGKPYISIYAINCKTFKVIKK
ncbi:MAG: hypothetical protein WCL51_10190 [Bacteroidota bacterium]